ncbi:unnamed protein product, partial [Oppiella nova]
MSSVKEPEKSEGAEVLKKRGYSMFVPLDSGGQGNVYKTTKNKVTFAAKVVHIDSNDKNLDDDLKRELTIIRNVKHPNCIRVEDMFRTKHKVYIIMDFMPNKSIGDEVDTKGPICEWKGKLYFAQISSAIKYLHRHNIAHRDLKLDNVLLDANYNAKVCDFGFSRFVPKDAKTGQIRKSKSYVGTPSYEPPEVVSHTPYDPYKCDVWCLGVCLFIILNYEYPFNGDDPKETLLEKQNKRQYTLQKTIDKKLSQLAKDLIRKLLEPNPNQRISITDVYYPIVRSEGDRAGT